MFKRLTITAILTIALTLLSFGHRSMSPEAQVQAYVLAGGSLADLCDGNNSTQTGLGACPACVISHGCVLATPPQTIQQAQIGHRVRWSVSHEPTRPLNDPWSHAARAPPFV